MLTKLKLLKLTRRQLLLAVAAVVVVSAGSYAAFQAFSNTQDAPQEEELHTARVRQGDLILYASGSGILISTMGMSERPSMSA